MCRAVAPALLLLSMAACQRQPDPAAPDPAAAATQGGTLSVEVSPAEGISIWLDEAKLATSAPFTAQGLPLGAHTLLVRGMGYVPFSLPVVLQPGEVVHVPVALQRRPPPPQDVVPPPMAPVPQPQPVAAPQPVRARSQPDLPAGVAPLHLQLVAEPEAPVVLDGMRLAGRDVRLTHARGSMQVGALQMGYSVTPTQVLELDIRADAGQWFKDALPLAPPAVVRLTLGSTRLRRTHSDGTDQSLIIRRLP